MKKIFTIIILIIAFTMSIFHIYSGGIKLFPALQQRSIHLGLAFSLIFLTYPFFKKKPGEQAESESNLKKSTPFILNAILAAASLYVGYYIMSQYLTLPMELLSPSTATLVVGTIVIILTLEVTRRALGWALPILSILALIYAFFGENLPLLIQHSGFSFEEIVTQVGLSGEGVFGVPLGVSATYVVLFVIFGSVLEKSGGGNLFMDLSMALVGRFRGGAAKISVISSSLFASISGSQVANVVTTGVLTIPLMRRGGYKPAYAAAIESVASTGGILLPPVMGAVAFLMADFLQISYAEVALAAIIPAVLYYISIFITVDLKAGKEGLKPVEEENKIDLKKLIIKKGHLLFPIIVLITLLLVFQYTATKAAFWSIVSIPVICLFRKETRMSFKDIAEALINGAKLSLVVVAACACAGIVIGVINMTGMGLRFSSVLLELSAGNLFLLALLTAIASIIMGMGLPPVASYIVLAVLAAPAMVELGVSPIGAHLFIFYFGALSGITPPVALAAYAASAISGANPHKIGFIACRMALVAFVIPFMFIYGPSLILEGSALSIIIAALSAVIGVFALSAAVEGFLLQKINWLLRILLLVGALLLMHVGVITDIIGLVIIMVIFSIEFMKNKQTQIISKAHAN